MPENEPLTKLDARYSDEKATADDWTDAVERLKAAETYWLSTVRPEGRPHVTPLIGVWHDGGLHFCTGADERKAKNLRDNREVVLTTGANALGEGYDVVVEGAAARVSDETRLRALADAYVEKYGSDWTFEVRDGAFVHQAGTALVFRVEPRTAFGFAKSPYGQTRWQFSE
ncbi:pyridoxamine 5'-phosphate oxidase family protein [Streptomyces sp. NBC_00879]|uniref:pyridoxamine 5'-phosphate oxidase family protein n=1 Tax=Streptomyces sp. NBC_00879 TaxID=2975855 RepID=UPI00386BEBED|nr:pyridoxamine 5'-phosphate oxidase family protein [Streptomyces sp. NBC_00879]